MIQPYEAAVDTEGEAGLIFWAAGTAMPSARKRCSSSVSGRNPTSTGTS